MLSTGSATALCARVSVKSLIGSPRSLCAATSQQTQLSSQRASAAPVRVWSPASLYRPQRTRGTASSATMSAGTLSYRQPLVVPARSKHSATMIMLHGLGDQGEGWGGIVQDLAGQLPHVKFVFPHAPLPGWYDIHSLGDINQEEDTKGLMESKRFIEGLVQQEVSAGIPSDRVVVGGFSQGGAVAMLMLRSDIKLAGIVGLSTYLPLRKQPPVISEANKTTPILQCHGDADTTVQFHFGVETHNQLKAAGGNVDFKVYNGMGHSACAEELDAVQSFLKKVLP